MLKKGAMFGLDARIALAIFGALSVISGAALYSAIQQSKVVAIVADLREVHKAYEAYYLDTGQEIPQLSSGSIILQIQELVDNSLNVSGWKGPYSSLEKHSTNYYLKSGQYDKVAAFSRSINDAWGGVNGVDLTLPSSCTGSAEPCGRWVMLYSFDKSIAEAVDKYVDGSVDYKNGRVRINQEADGTCNIYLLDGNTKPTS